MDFQVMELPAVRVAYLRYKGPFGPAIGEFWKEVFTPWMQAFRLTGRVTYGVAQDDPNTTPPSECRYDACVAVDGGYQIVAPAKEASIPAGRYAVAQFKGTADEISGEWGAFFGQLHASGQSDAGACFERYPADYTMDPQTGVFNCELCIPVK